MSKWWHGALHRLCCTVTVPCSPPSYTTVVTEKALPPSKRDQPVIAAVVYTGLRKEPCESGGNCVKSPCELPVRWLADGWVCCRPTAKAGGEAGGEEREGQRGGRDRGEGEAGCSKQIRQGAGSLSTHVFHLVERTLSAKQGEEGG